jgi:hypothetical protein
VSEYDEVVNLQRMQSDNGYDDTSEEGKLLACVQDESVTYASTRDLEPPQASSTIYERFVVTSEQRVISPMAPVTVQVHSEHHVSQRKRIDFVCFSDDLCVFTDFHASFLETR